MGDVIELPATGGRRSAPDFDLVLSKLRPPRRGHETVTRAITNLLVRGEMRPVVSVVAPAGFGKTTLLAEVGERAEQNGQSFAWVSLDERDNDPRVMLAYVATALDQVQPVGDRVFDALASPATSLSGSVVPRLAAAFAAMTSPVVLVLDDVHLLENRECRSALSVLAEHVPPESALVLSGRDPPPVRVARLRAEGRITEVGPKELALTRGEAASVLRAANMDLGPEEVAVLHERTEGWPVGLYLAALYLREGGSVDAAAATFGGDDRLVSDYMESELLNRISRSHRTFLTRSAALTSMSGALCEAALDLPDAASTMADVAGSNLLLVPLDRRGHWYRYHHLFGEMLLAQLERVEPGVADVVRRRAASWCLKNERTEDALEYSIASGDVDTVVRLFRELWRPLWWQRRFGTLMRWLHWIDQHGDDKAHFLVAGPAARIAMHEGNLVLADRWARLMDRWLGDGEAAMSDPLAHAEALLTEADLCRAGVEQMRTDADEAAKRLEPLGVVAPGAQMYGGIARIVLGQFDEGEAKLEEAVRIGTEHGIPVIVSYSVCQQALLAQSLGAFDRCDALVEEASATLHEAGMEDALTETLLAERALRRGDEPVARAHLGNAQRLLPDMTYVNPVVAVQTRIELARTHLDLGAPDGARTMVQEIDQILARRPDLGSVRDSVDDIRTRLADPNRRRMARSSTLTSAELRLLPMLCTHLTYQEIADELFLSRHTIHAQTRSMFRKLDAKSRSEAVTRSRELRLLDD